MLFLISLLLLTFSLSVIANPTSLNYEQKAYDKPNVFIFNGFDYLTHGADWGGYSPYCITGKQQSPIDLATTQQSVYSGIHYFLANFTASKTTYLIATYENTTLILNNGQGFGDIYAVDPAGGMWGYQAQSIKFRCESEHIFNGTHYPLEIQIGCQVEYYYYLLFTFHKQTLKRAINPDHQLMIISIFFEEKSEQSNSSFLHTIIQANKTNSSAFILDLNPLLNLTTSNFMDYWSYFGSNTEPYCSQTYIWYVMRQTFEANPEQIQFFRDQYYNQPKFKGQGNYRNVDNGRSTDIKLLYFPAND